MLDDGSGNTECTKGSCDNCLTTDCVETAIGCAAGPMSEITQALIDNGITFSSAADCDAANANLNKQELLDGNTTLTTCCDQCVCAGLPPDTCYPPEHPNAATLNPLILETLLDTAEAGFDFQVESLTTGDHSPSSAHYEGAAVDVTPPTAALKSQLEIACAGLCSVVPEASHLHMVF